jgi:hypothetical protein
MNSTTVVIVGAFVLFKTYDGNEDGLDEIVGNKVF